MKNNIFYKTIPIVFLLLTYVGCTDLEEEILDESLTGTGQAEIVSGSIAPVYGLLRQVWVHTVNFGLQEVASDESILPYRGGTDWFDGGKFIAVHQHLMTPGNGLVRDAWTFITQTLSRTVIAEERLRVEAESNNDAEAKIALYEMIAMKAYLNMLALDNFGLVFKKESSDKVSEILRGQEAVDYIESDLLSVVDDMTNVKGRGRLTKDAVKALLARLYLNAAVYRDPYGTPNFTDEDMDKVIRYTNDIISGPYSLSPEYFDLFNDDNDTNSEIIFALDQRGVLQTEHSRWAYWSASGDQIPRPEFPNTRGTDAAAATPDFVQTWIDAYGNDPASGDARFFKENTVIPEELKDLTGVTPLNDSDHYYCVPANEFEIDRGIIDGIIWGPRKDEGGNILTCEDGSVRIYPVINRRTSGSSLSYVDHTLQIDFTAEGSLHNTGNRFSKYQFSRTAPNCCTNSSVDLVLIRLGEIYLMRAEAKLRKGDNAGALADVNTLRTSRNARPDQTPAALTSIDLDILFRETGFELYWEGFRRNYQIRFGKYEDSWTGKTDSDVNKRLFPIPQSAIDGASSEEGFLVQNRGY
jgi:starch-binding outer membrane protein, SusD/RagB family